MFVRDRLLVVRSKTERRQNGSSSYKAIDSDLSSQEPSPVVNREKICRRYLSDRHRLAIGITIIGNIFVRPRLRLAHNRDSYDPQTRINGSQTSGFKLCRCRRRIPLDFHYRYFEQEIDRGTKQHIIYDLQTNRKQGQIHLANSIYLSVSIEFHWILWFAAVLTVWVAHWAHIESSVRQTNILLLTCVVIWPCKHIFICTSLRTLWWISNYTVEMSDYRDRTYCSCRYDISAGCPFPSECKSMYMRANEHCY